MGSTIADNIARLKIHRETVVVGMRVSIHLGLYILQQLYNLTDRQAEYALHDNAAFFSLLSFP